jgi:hypothetical protein
MNHEIDDTWRHLRFGESLLAGGESLLAGGVESLAQGWKASTEMIGKLWNGGAERWQAANRQIQVASVSLADILRARTST